MFPAYVLRFPLPLVSRKGSQGIAFVPVSYNSSESTRNVPSIHTKISVTTVRKLILEETTSVSVSHESSCNVLSIRTKIPAMFTSRKRSQDIAFASLFKDSTHTYKDTRYSLPSCLVYTTKPPTPTLLHPTPSTTLSSHLRLNLPTSRIPLPHPASHIHQTSTPRCTNPAARVGHRASVSEVGILSL
ncbi:hypothetical protein BC629DRAFT_185393 [Irpex lacteus]|nr:hypothetical protein BC629DRAFT_185393 [Irpex lacteus]